MRYTESGMILFVERFDACLLFYRDLLGLPVRAAYEYLVIFEIGHGYFMLEQQGVASAGQKTRAQNPVVLRFDVPDLDQAMADLRARGADFPEGRLDFAWGSIAPLLDPDGNRIELKQGTTS
jgi:lactoylglutathione lyase